MKDKGEVRIQSLSQIDSVYIVLTSSKNQPLQGYIARINVNPPSPLREMLSLNSIGYQLYIYNRIWRDEFGERYELPV